MRLLVVGGTGNISWRLSAAAVEAGWEVTLLNRGGHDRVRRAAPPGCTVLTTDIHDVAATSQLLASREFDAVVDFLCFNGDQARRAVHYFGGRCAQYVFISTTAMYDRGRAPLPLAEDSPVTVQGWDYAMRKLEAEQVFLDARRSSGFPVSIVRAGHTYDTIIPEAVGESDWTNPWRILHHKPVVVHGDGTTLWTLTHSLDFARGVMALLQARPEPGEAYQITADVCCTWRDITALLGETLGVSNPEICYRTTEEIARISPRLGNGIFWHKMWCDIYDNRKFKALCPAWAAQVSLEEGLRQAVQYFQSDPRLTVPNAQLNATLDALCALR